MESGPPVDAAALVRRGYDSLGPKYAGWTEAVDPPFREEYAERATSDLTAGATVVELGCGPGVPVGQRLAARFTYLGFDLSTEMLRLARRNVPSGHFVSADMSTMALTARSVDAVVAFYSLVHVPRERHAALFTSIWEWLRPGGRFALSLGTSDNPADVKPDWLGAGPMFWSSHDTATSQRLLRDAGFVLDRAEEADQFEGEKRRTFLWVDARKPR